MRYITLLSLTTLLFSCQPKQNLSLKSPIINLAVEGPIFEGANTAVGTWKINADEWLATKGLEKNQVTEIQILAVEYTPTEGFSANQIEEITLQTTSQNFNMQKIAFLNPYPKSDGSVLLSIAKEQENLLQLFDSNEITFVADLNLKDDIDANLSMNISVTFNIIHSKK